MRLFASLAIVILTMLDQLSKNFAQNNFLEPFMIIDPWFRFRFVENHGVAFSMPVPSPFVIVLTVVVLGYLMLMLGGKSLEWEKGKGIRKKALSLNRWETIAIILVFAGALGNLIDRIRFGAVTDFIAVGNFPVFNLADTWISVGVAVYLIGELFMKQKK